MKKISVIIPVYKEKENINTIIEQLYSQDFSDFETIVVDSEDTKETLKAIRNKEVIRLSSPKGRSLQMNHGAKEAKGNILLFLHADTKLCKGALTMIEELLKDSKYTAGSFSLGIEQKGIAYRLIEFVANFRSRLSRIPYGDQAIFIKKDYFINSGLFKDFPLMEDVELMQRLKRDGKNICIFPEKVFTSARRWQKEGIIYCTLRNWIIVSLYYLGVHPRKLVRYYK